MDYTVFQSVDWLSYTSKLRLGELGYDYEDTWDISPSGMNGYEFKATEPESGMFALWSDKRPDMGTHVILSGAVCQYFRGVGFTDAGLVQDAIRRGKISRIDVAITSHPNSNCAAHELQARHIQALYDKGMVRTRMRKNKGFSNEGTQRTFYIGSGGKNNQFRSYDKGYELGRGGAIEGLTNWLERYELQANKKTAKTVARLVASGTDFGQIMNRYIEVDNPAWRHIVGAKKVAITHVDEPDEPDTIGWLRSVAASALAKQAILYRDTVDTNTGNTKDPLDVIEWFNHVVLQKIREIDDKLD